MPRISSAANGGNGVPKIGRSRCFLLGLGALTLMCTNTLLDFDLQSALDLNDHNHDSDKDDGATAVQKYGTESRLENTRQTPQLMQQMMQEFQMPIQRSSDGRWIYSTTKQTEELQEKKRTSRQQKRKQKINTTFVKRAAQLRNASLLVPPAAKNISISNGSDPDALKVVWLMSFPNSGTTYTLKYVQTSTNTTTATNYGAVEQICCNTTIPIHPTYNQGPYFRHPDRPHPTERGNHLILTKTHCGADAPDVMALDHDIERHCRTGNKKLNHTTTVPTEYPRHLVAKAVHLIRNPFDNVVSRMHYRQRHAYNSNNSQKDDDEHQQPDFHNSSLSSTTTSPKDDFQQWCRDTDAHTVERKREQWLAQFPDPVAHWRELLRPVPCFTEFVRWVRWHQQIWEMTQQRQPPTFPTNNNHRQLRLLPTLTLYYENYTTNFDATTAELLDFLETAPAPLATPLAFVLGKTYPEFYETEQVTAIRRLVQTLASPGLWELIRHYFE